MAEEDHAVTVVVAEHLEHARIGDRPPVLSCGLHRRLRRSAVGGGRRRRGAADEHEQQNRDTGVEAMLGVDHDAKKSPQPK